jgi:general secretion pathway protein J
MNVPSQKTAGFTLLELMVAMAIFAFLATIMYGGTRWIIDQREIVQLRVAELNSLQRAVRHLSADFGQLYPRAIRDELGRGGVSALNVERSGELLISLTRGGWRNPNQAANRGHLQRVQYRYDRDAGLLHRVYWPVIERVLGQEPREKQLLEGVTEFEIEFLDFNDNWQQNWPTPDASSQTELPKAVRYRMQLESFGAITRLVEIPG